MAGANDVFHLKGSKPSRGGGYTLMFLPAPEEAGLVGKCQLLELQK